MIRNIEFSNDQRRLITTKGSLFVEACPGAGKTQSIIERFVQRPNASPRSGVALLSFTNASIDELKSRCASHPEHMDAPNYVGTLDGFINNFIVGPLFLHESGVKPTFRDVWATAHGTDFVVGGIRFGLEWFQFSRSGEATLIQSLVPLDIRDPIKRLNQTDRKMASDQASAIMRDLVSRGILDSASSRMKLNQYIEDHVRVETVSRLISIRFSEIIVDECQDCSEEDIRMLQFAQDSGVNLVLVGDMEQSIFEFRNSSIKLTREFGNSMTTRFRLNKNFRSTAIINSVNNSLKCNEYADVAAGEYAELQCPVRIAEYVGTPDGNIKIVGIANEMGFRLSDIVVLSPYRRDAIAAAGASPIPATSVNQLVLLARSASSSRVRSPDQQRARKEFMATLRYLVRGPRKFRRDEEFFEEIGVTHRDFEDGCMRLAYCTEPYEHGPEEYMEILRNGIESLDWCRWMDLDQLIVPTSEEWGNPARLSKTPLAWSTIHAFKGRQSPVVALVIPRLNKYYGSGLKDWFTNEESERRRVLYVGASRAQQLLIMCVEREESAYLRSIVNHDGIVCQ